MQKHDGPLFVVPGPGMSMFHYSFDDERNEVTMTCRGCGCTAVAPTEPLGLQEMTLEHESDCQVLTLIESASCATAWEAPAW